MGKTGTRRYYDHEFKSEAVRMVTERGLKVTQVARDLGIHPNMLSRWKREYIGEGNHAFVGKGHMKPEQEEVRRLRREVEVLWEERDILKKALAIFSRQGKSGTGL
jgi:transposase